MSSDNVYDVLHTVVVLLTLRTNPTSGKKVKLNIKDYATFVTEGGCMSFRGPRGTPSTPTFTGPRTTRDKGGGGQEGRDPTRNSRRTHDGLTVMVPWVGLGHNEERSDSVLRTTPGQVTGSGETSSDSLLVSYLGTPGADGPSPGTETRSVGHTRDSFVFRGLYIPPVLDTTTSPTWVVGGRR